MGVSNPLQIMPDSGYYKLISYWKGDSAKPTPAVAFKVFMQLTEDIKAENCLFHKEVIDAMFKQANTVE